MGILDKLKRARELQRLRGQVRSSPSPISYADLAERLVHMGEIDEALEAAEEGLARFADAERLQQVRLYALKERYADRIRELRDDMVRHPSPEAYTELAEIYRELKSYDDALDISAQCAKRFPQHEGPHVIQGEIRMERFVKDRVAKDGLMAEEALREVLRLNPHSPKAHLLLAELYYLVGDVDPCKEHLQQVLTLMPSAREIHAFLHVNAARVEGDEDPTFRDRVAAVEQSGRFANPPEGFPRAQSSQPRSASGPALEVDTAGLRSEIVKLGDNDGLRNAIILDGPTTVVADFSGLNGLARDAFAELVSNLGATADDASRRMDTGTLVRAEIFGPSGNLTVARLRNLTIAILYSTPLRAATVWDLVQGFVASNLTESEEFAGA